MKSTFLLSLPLFFILLVASCRPSQEQLRSELREIDSELLSIQIAMNQHQSQMNQAEVEGLVGSFAAGYGATSGDYALAADGTIATSEAIRKYDVSTFTLQQLQARYFELTRERTLLATKLK